MPFTFKGEIVCRDFAELPDDEQELRQFCTDIIGSEVFKEIKQYKAILASGAGQATRDTPNPELSLRECTVTGGFTWTP